MGWRELSEKFPAQVDVRLISDLTNQLANPSQPIIFSMNTCFSINANHFLLLVSDFLEVLQLMPVHTTMVASTKSGKKLCSVNYALPLHSDK